MAKKSINDILGAQYFFEFQEQRTTATCRVINLVDRCTTTCSNFCQQVAHFGRGIKLTSLGSRIKGIHLDKVLIADAKHIKPRVLILVKLEVAHALQKSGQKFTTLGHCSSQARVVGVEVGKQALHITLTRSSDGTILESTEIVGKSSV